MSGRRVPSSDRYRLAANELGRVQELVRRRERAAKQRAEDAKLARLELREARALLVDAYKARDEALAESDSFHVQPKNLT